MTKTPEYFKDKTILITGAASGIGEATALIFAREGASVVCADINGDGAKRVAEKVAAAGVGAEAVTVDVTDRASVRGMIDKAITRFGRIDCQFNSAGSALKRAPFLEIDEDLWDRTYDLNVKGVFFCMQEVLPHMLENGGGVIVNMASTAHFRGGAGHSVHYASSKGSVVTMTLGVAREFAGRGIRCLSVSPTVVDTPFHEISPPELTKSQAAGVPMNRVGRPDEVGELVLFMCSDACRFMTADTVYMTGGSGYR